MQHDLLAAEEGQMVTREGRKLYNYAGPLFCHRKAVALD